MKDFSDHALRTVIWKDWSIRQVATMETLTHRVSLKSGYQSEITTSGPGWKWCPWDWVKVPAMFMSKIGLVLKTGVGLKLQAGMQVVLAEDTKRSRRLGDRQPLPLSAPLTSTSWDSAAKQRMALPSQICPYFRCGDEPFSLFSNLPVLALTRGWFSERVSSGNKEEWGWQSNLGLGLWGYTDES